MKEKELREHTTCSLCRKKTFATGLPLFWTVTIERHGLLVKAVERQQGLTMLLGGHAVLAQAMGLDEEMTQPMMEPIRLTICENCATESMHCVAVLAEIGAEGK